MCLVGRIGASRQLLSHLTLTTKIHMAKERKASKHKFLLNVAFIFELVRVS